MRAAARLDAAAAMAAVKSGDTVFVASAAATPTPLLRALYARAATLHDVTLLHFVTDGVLDGRPPDGGPFVHRTLFVGREMRELLDRASGAVEYVPLSIAEVPRLVRAGRLRADVALLQTTRPAADGSVRLGVGVDIAACMVDGARRVVVEANRQMPAACGDNVLAPDRIDALVETDRPLPTYRHAPADAVSRQVAAYIGSLIDDGSTLHVGVGQIPNEALRFLRGRRHLGIHTDALTDAVLDLIDAGIADGMAKSSARGVAVASYCFGSAQLYARLDGDPRFALQPIDRVCAPEVVAAQHRMVSITQAFSVDLTGQACCDQFDGRLYGGVAAQPDFLRATAAAPGGKPIVCLASTTADGAVSRIRPCLPAGEGVTLARADMHWVVTEYGVANLFAKSVGERALALVEIAHPAFRPWLLDEARRLGLLRAEQTVVAPGAWPVAEAREIVLADGSAVRARPARASDAPALRLLFHDLSADDVYTRFFRRLRCLAFADADRLCNVDHVNDVAFVIGAGAELDAPVVATAAYYVGRGDAAAAEVAYLVHPQWQGRGLGAALQRLLFEHGRRHGVRRFVAEVLRSNARMVRLARAACADVRTEADGDVLTIVMTP